jgi:hypothetical protein
MTRSTKRAKGHISVQKWPQQLNTIVCCPVKEKKNGEESGSDDNKHKGKSMLLFSRRSNRQVISSLSKGPKVSHGLFFLEERITKETLLSSFIDNRCPKDSFSSLGRWQLISSLLYLFSLVDLLFFCKSLLQKEIICKIYCLHCNHIQEKKELNLIPVFRGQRTGKYGSSL